MTYNATHVHFQYLYADDHKVHKEVWIVKDKTLQTTRPSAASAQFPSKAPSPKVQKELALLNTYLARTQITEGNIKDFLIGFGIGLGVSPSTSPI